jgi:homopolymeric O-antigen transport system permease protein
MSEQSLGIPAVRRSFITLDWIKEFWPYREIFFFLAWRDIKIRYRQTALGAVWAVVQPLLTALVFTVLFGRVGKVPSDGMPYPLFSYTALLAWIYVSSSVSSASGSLVGNSELIRKVYFPRAIIPAASVLVPLVDMTIAVMILLAMMVYYRIRPSLELLLWPVIVFELVALTLGIGLILAAVNVKYRDVKHALPFAIQLWLFLSPIIYPVSMIPRRFRMWLALNPLTGIIEALRASVSPTKQLNWHLLGISAGITLILFVAGVAYFKNTERAFADIV